MTPDFWSRCCERLLAELPEQQFNTWIRPLAAPLLADEGPGQPHASVARMEVPNRFKLDWMRSQYGRLLEDVMSDVVGSPVRLELVLSPQRPAAANGGTSVAVRQPASVGRILTRSLMGAGSQAAERGPSADAPGAMVTTGFASAATNPSGASSNRLNPALTFDTLVAGRANQMARTAALHVAGAPGHMYNPLFIYGGVGLGKTHLIHAVGNALLKDKPGARILYLHAEQFISDVVKNYQRKTFDELKAKYHQLDLLLIDDVQFFAGKERTQE